MLVDGLGDGVMIEGPFDLSFLRTTSFATLQVGRWVVPSLCLLRLLGEKVDGDMSRL